MKKLKQPDEMRPEYNFSDFKSPPVRGKYYARIIKEGIQVVVLNSSTKSTNKTRRSMLKGKSMRTKDRAVRKRARA